MLSVIHVCPNLGTFGIPLLLKSLMALALTI